MIIPKYSTHLTLCAGDRGTFTLSDGHLLLRCRADTIELPTERQNCTPKSPSTIQRQKRLVKTLLMQKL